MNNVRQSTLKDYRDISVVAQGPIDPVWTPQCLRSIRDRLPGSTIILSTQDQETLALVENLYDELVLVDGDVFVFQNEGLDFQGNAFPMKKQNLNKQIQTSYAGLCAVRTPYAMKLRTDMIVEGGGFFSTWQHYQDSPQNISNKFTRGRILVGCHTTRIAKTKTFFKHYRCPFNISDFMMFGYTEDILNIWSLPFISENEAFFFKDYTEFFYKNWGYKIKNYMQFLPEQYIWINFVRKFLDVSMEIFFDNRYQIVKMYEKFLAENLIVLSQKRLQISLPRRNTKYVNRYFDYMFEDWLFLYKKYFLKKNDIFLFFYCLVIRKLFLIAALPSIILTKTLNTSLGSIIKRRVVYR